MPEVPLSCFDKQKLVPTEVYTKVLPVEMVTPLPETAMVYVFGSRLILVPLIMYEPTTVILMLVFADPSEVILTVTGFVILKAAAVNSICEIALAIMMSDNTQHNVFLNLIFKFIHLHNG